MNVLVAISTVTDGNMLIPEDKSNTTVASDREMFLKKHSISMNQTTRVDITYERSDFCRYREVSEPDMGAGMYDDDVETADALVTCAPDHALFLPVADCVGAVIYDPIHHVLMLTHIGRHSLEQNGAFTSLKYLVDRYGSNPMDLKLWLTPAPGKNRYPVYAFGGRDFKEIVFEQLHAAGIVHSNISDNPADSTTDPNYFSHSEFLAGRRKDDGRYGIAAMMIDKV